MDAPDRMRPERILTTHTGSLPRPDDLIALLRRRSHGALGSDEEEIFSATVRRAVGDVVATQVATGIDLVNDGEMGKAGFSIYAAERLTGFGGESALSGLADVAEFPGFAARHAERMGNVTAFAIPACVGPVAYRNPDAVRRDLDNLRAALASVGKSPGEAFVTAASPGVLATTMENRHYPSHEAYVGALATAMATEYGLVAEAGFALQIDAPDLAMGRHAGFADLPLDAFRRVVALHVEALNHATAGIPPERMRLHVCWGNYEGPHHRDVPLRDIADLVLRARPAGLSVEAANPRHAHEWRLWERVALPDDKVLIPGVIDTTTNYVEHPELVAERIVRLARVVDRERVIAGTDCGLSTFAGYAPVDPAIAWAKLGSLIEGARLASEVLWAE